jgi:hypothetical protein
MAVHYITTDTNIHDITDWADYDELVVKSGATLTIDNAGNGLEIWRIGDITVYDGSLVIENTTNYGLELLFNGSSTFILITPEGSLTINGQLIPLHTSDGTAGQTFQFWDVNYGYQISGLFLENDNFGMLMDAYSSLTTYTPANSNIRLYTYDASTATFTLGNNFYIPPNGTIIYAPNILIKYEGTQDTNIGTTAEYIQFTFAKNVSIKGAYLICLWKSTNADTVTFQDCVFAYPSELSGITNLTIDHCLVTADAENHNALNITWCNNVNMTNITYYGKGSIDSNTNITCDTWYVFNHANKYYNVLFTNCENLNISNFQYNYCEAGIFSYCKDVNISNCSFRFDDDYNQGYDSLIGTSYCEKFNIDTITVCDNFYYTGRVLFKFDEKTNKSSLKNTWIDISYTNTQGYYPSFFQIRGGSYNNMIYNSGWSNALENTGLLNQTYSDTYLNHFIKVNLFNQKTYIQGKNQVFKDFKFIGWTNTDNIGTSNGKITINNSDGTSNTESILFTFGMPDNYTIEVYGTSIYSDNQKLFFENAGDYVIIKPTKEQSGLRQLKSIISHTISGSFTDRMDFYLSIDKGQTWIPESEWDGLTFSDDEIEIWLKFGNNQDFPTNVSYIQLNVELDTTKPDYEPYWLWTELDFENLPLEQMYCSYQVEGQELHKFITNSTFQYITYELWRDNPNNITAKVRKYGYSFYESTSIFNNEKVLFYYTGYKNPYITKTLDEALSITGVVLQQSSDIDYTWELDCGGNYLSDVYHYIQAKLTSFNTDLAGLDSFTLNEFLVPDGDGYKTLQIRPNEGVKLINYAGKATSFTKDDGTIYVLPQTVSFTLTNIKEGSEVRIYKADDMTELAGVESITSSTFTYTYQWTQDIPVVVVIFHLQYQPIRFETTLTNSDTTIPIQQVYDRDFYNPD